MPDHQNLFDTINKKLYKERLFPLDEREKLIYSEIIKDIENRNYLRQTGI